MITCIIAPTLQKLLFSEKQIRKGPASFFCWEKLEIPKKEATNKAEDKYDEAKHNNLKTRMSRYVEIIWEQFLPSL